MNNCGNDWFINLSVLHWSRFGGLDFEWLIKAEGSGYRIWDIPRNLYTQGQADAHKLHVLVSVSNKPASSCKAANMIEWFNEQRADMKKWVKVVAWYKKHCPPTKVNGNMQMGKFKVLQFQNEVMTYQQQLRDGQREMMHVS